MALDTWINYDGTHFRNFRTGTTTDESTDPGNNDWELYRTYNLTMDEGWTHTTGVRTTDSAYNRSQQTTFASDGMRITAERASEGATIYSSDAQGRYAPSTALPSETELSEQFETSRNVIREAVRVLSEKRLIDAQCHRGLFVMPREQWNYLDADVLDWVLEKGANPSLIRSLIEVRNLIEPNISRWAAERATAVDLMAMETRLNEMAASLNDSETFQAADIQFHRAVLVASRNVVIQQLSDAVGALQRAIFDYTFKSDTGHLELTMDEHHDLFDAIRRKNPDMAEHASRRMATRTARRALHALDNARNSQTKTFVS